MSRVLVGFDETTENRGHRTDGRTRTDGHGFFERLLHKSPKGAIMYIFFEIIFLLKKINVLKKLP